MEKMTSKKILKILEMHKPELQKFGVKKIGLFGSHLKNSVRNKGDMDFLVELSNPTFDNYIELKFLLEKIFRKKVDLVIEKNLKPSMQYVKEKALYAKAV